MNFDRSKILIGVPGTFNETHSKNWIECESTWIPKLREKGYNVKIILSDPEQSKNLDIKGNFFITKNSDLKDELYHKRWSHISEYVIGSDDYDFYFNIDSDCFVHPERFDDMMSSIVNFNEPVDYLGCCIPYRGWNTYKSLFTKITDVYCYASGSAILLSKKSLSILKEKFDPAIHTELHFDDKVVGDILRGSVSFYHDSRILFFSKYDMAEVIYPSNEGPTFISDIDSQLAIQHYCNDHMREIMNKIYN